LLLYLGKVDVDIQAARRLLTTVSGVNLHTTYWFYNYFAGAMRHPA